MCVCLTVHAVQDKHPQYDAQINNIKRINSPVVQCMGWPQEQGREGEEGQQVLWCGVLGTQLLEAPVCVCVFYIELSVG